MTDNTAKTENNQEQTQTQTSMMGGAGQEQQNVGNESNQAAATENATTGAPESIDGYQVDVEGFNYDEFKAIPENQEFLERAREAGLDSKSLNFLLGEYNQLLPAIMEGNAALDSESCTQAMTEIWKGDTAQNFGYAQAAANNAIQNGILTPEEVNSPEFGNNQLVLKMAAYFGQQLGEDTPPSITQQSGAVDVQSLMASEAYMNEGHPDHKRVYAEVQKAYA